MAITALYAGELPGIQQRAAARVPAVVHAVCGHQARRLFENYSLPAGTTGPEEPEERVGDIADAFPCCGRPARTSKDWKPPCWQPASPAPAPASPC